MTNSQGCNYGLTTLTSRPSLGNTSISFHSTSPSVIPSLFPFYSISPFHQPHASVHSSPPSIPSLKLHTFILSLHSSYPSFYLSLQPSSSFMYSLSVNSIISSISHLLPSINLYPSMEERIERVGR